jgi:hypothetical protein
LILAPGALDRSTAKIEVHDLGLLLGGEEGTELVRHAEEAMKAQGVRMAARSAAVIVPERWRAA